MARARNIKPALFLNELLGKADPLLTILFVSLWCLADRDGRLEDNPERIRIQTFPYRSEMNVERMLVNLQRMGFITRYKVNESKLIQVIQFKKHQSPHHTEKKSVLPPCDANSLICNTAEKVTVKEPLDDRGLTLVKRSDSLIPDSLIPDSLIPDSKTYATASTKNVDLDFEEAWKIYPKRPGANKTQAYRQWVARLKEGVAIIDMQRGVWRYGKYCEAMQTEPQYIKQMATFLGKDKHWRSDWTPTVARQKTASGQQGEFITALTGQHHDTGFIDIGPETWLSND